MDLSLQGKLTKVLPVQSGVGKNSGKEWKRQSFVIEIQDGAYATEVAFDIFGDKPNADVSKYAIGTMLTVRFDIRSHEYNGRYFSNITAWSVEPAQGSFAVPSQPAVAPQNSSTVSAPTAPTTSSTQEPVTDSDLPF